MNPIRISALLVLSIILYVVSCSEPSETTNPDCQESFNRSQMLTNFADSIIIPNLEELQSRVNTLQQSTENFNQNTHTSTLNDLQTAWTQTYMAWQHCSAYNFGPGDMDKGFLVSLLATFPVADSSYTDNFGNDRKGIEAFIDENNSEISSLNNNRVKGFLAVEYLIFDRQNGQEGVINDFSSDNHQARKNYLIALVDDIQSKINSVTSEWKNGYRDEFIDNDGTGRGSSVSELFNHMVQDYESIKNFKFGVPSGLRAGQEERAPEQVEAYYSGQSLQFAKEHIQASKNHFRGVDMNGNNGTGWDDYLTGFCEEDLMQNMIDQYDQISSLVDQIPEDQPLSESIQNNFSPVQTAFESMQQQVTYYKTNMASKLGIAITYNSGDGD